MTTHGRLITLALACLWSVAVGAEVKSFPSPEPTAAARRVAKQIREAVLLPPNGPQGRPLPLASHWNASCMIPGTFTPDRQIELLQQGHHILPRMQEPAHLDGVVRCESTTGPFYTTPENKFFHAYYEPLVDYIAELNLPFSMMGTQWEAMLLSDKKHKEAPEALWAGVINSNGVRLTRITGLDPFGPVEAWKEPAGLFAASVGMKWLQNRYPDPPRVLWVGNNEAPKLSWFDVHHSKRYLERYGENRSDEFKRRVVAEGWKERYGVMFDAMRKALVNETWRKNLRFVGYDAFGPPDFGRFDGWDKHSLYTEDEMAWEWRVWDGGSPSYYTHSWNKSRDHWVHSTQVESMNWIFMLEQAWKANPDYWFEISAWDGSRGPPWMKALGATAEDLAEKSSRPLNEEQRKQLDEETARSSKSLQYMRDGQTYPPERALGWIQYGLWLLRPRVVREFRDWTEQLKPLEPYWMQTVKAVDRVWNNETLREFWRHGELVPNTAQQHPYQSDIPERMKDVRRWYLLETDLDPKRPWGLETNLPVLSLALMLQEREPGFFRRIWRRFSRSSASSDRTPGVRRWLVYAHSPLEDRAGVGITVPGYRDIRVDVPRVGAFYLVDEASGKVTKVRLEP